VPAQQTKGAEDSRLNRSLITALIVASSLIMENLDGTVIATSLPLIAADLGTSPLSLKLAMTSYMLALAIFIPASGWVADRFGARNVFRAALVIFITGSILSGLSQSLEQLVVARVIQGIGGSMMTPVGRLIVLRSVPRSQMIEAFTWLTFPAMIGPMIGAGLMGPLSPESLFLATALAHFVLAGYTLLRIRRRAPVPLEEREAFKTLPAERGVTPEVARLDPRAEEDA